MVSSSSSAPVVPATSGASPISDCQELTASSQEKNQHNSSKPDIKKDSATAPPRERIHISSSACSLAQYKVHYRLKPKSRSIVLKGKSLHYRLRLGPALPSSSQLGHLSNPLLEGGDKLHGQLARLHFHPAKGRSLEIGRASCRERVLRLV